MAGSRIIQSSCIAAAGIALLLGGCSNQARLHRVEKQQANAVHGDPAPDPKILARHAIVVVIDREGQIFVQNEPLAPEGDLKSAIEKTLNNKRKFWPLTILVDPSQKGEILLNVIDVAERVKPGKVNVVTQEIEARV